MSNTKNKIQNIFEFLPKLATYTFCIYLIINIFMVVFAFPSIGHILKREFCDYNIIYFAISILIALLFILINIKFYNLKNLKINIKKVIIFGSIILFILQMIIMANKLFIAGWDVQKLFFTSEYDQLYFSQYPNNLFLKSFYGIFSKLFYLTGISNIFIESSKALFPWSNIANALTSKSAAEYVTYFFFVIINCALTTISVAFTTLIVNKIKGNELAVIVYVVTFIFIGLMPWILIPYSDTITMFCAILILYSYICINNKYIKWPIIFAITIIGFHIKPTLCFCFIAIIAIEVCRKISKFNDSKFIKWSNIVKQATSVIIVSAISFGIVLVCKNTNNISIDLNKEYTSTHFLMMGVNPDSEGFYNDEDITISSTCNSVEERESKNIEVWKNRISQMGPFNTVILLCKKSMCNYSDATFMWEMDAGPGFSVLTINNNQILDWIYKNYGPIAQTFWFCILIGCCLTIIIKNKSKEINIICATLLILSLFIMIFECGSRYLIQYLPYFVVLSSLGWNNFSAIIQAKLKMNN